MPGYAGLLTRTAVADLAGMTLRQEGVADSDATRHRIASIGFADAALLTPVLTLPAGSYEIAMLADWNVTAGPGSDHAAHISLYGAHVLLPIATSHAANKSLFAYFKTKGGPVAISFGLGNGATEKGFFELRQMKITRIAYQ